MYQTKNSKRRNNKQQMGCSNSHELVDVEGHASLLGRCWETQHVGGDRVESRWLPYSDSDNGQRPNYAFTLRASLMNTQSSFLQRHHLGVRKGVDVKVHNSTAVDAVSSDTILQSTERGLGGTVSVSGTMISLGAEFSRVRSAGPGRRSMFLVVVVKLFELELVPSQYKERGYDLHEVDTDIAKKAVREQFGEGIITQVLYGGYLVIDVEQENYEAMRDGLVARAKIGASPAGGGEIGGQFARTKTEGAKALNSSVRRVGGASHLMPSSFTNAPIEKVFSTVDRWIKDLMKNPHRATPISLYLQTYPGIIRHIQRHPKNILDDAIVEVDSRLQQQQGSSGGGVWLGGIGEGVRPGHVAPYNKFYDNNAKGHEAVQQPTGRVNTISGVDQLPYLSAELVYSGSGTEASPSGGMGHTYPGRVAATPPPPLGLNTAALMVPPSFDGGVSPNISPPYVQHTPKPPSGLEHHRTGPPSPMELDGSTEPLGYRETTHAMSGSTKLLFGSPGRAVSSENDGRSTVAGSDDGVGGPAMSGGPLQRQTTVDFSEGPSSSVMLQECISVSNDVFAEVQPSSAGNFHAGGEKGHDDDGSADAFPALPSITVEPTPPPSPSLDSVGSPIGPKAGEGRSPKPAAAAEAGTTTAPPIERALHPSHSIAQRMEENDALWRITSKELSASTRELEETHAHTESLQEENDRLEACLRTLRYSFFPDMDEISADATLDFLEYYLNDPSTLPEAEKDLDSAASWLPCAAVILQHPLSRADVLGIHVGLTDDDAHVLAGFLRGAAKVVGHTCTKINLANNEMTSRGAASVLAACIECCEPCSGSMMTEVDLSGNFLPQSFGPHVPEYSSAVSFIKEKRSSQLKLLVD